MDRRTFLTGTLSTASLAQPQAAIPIIDTHIHLFDTRRPQGVPWPPKDDAVLYKPALPDRYRKIAEPFGIKGAIEVECSPWVDDNQWVLDVAEKDVMIVGTVGNLEPASPDFRTHLDRLHRNPLFRGIRYGTLWNRDFQAQLKKPEFISGVKALAEAGLSLDTATASPSLIDGIVRLTDLVPGLRVIIDHLPQMEPPADAAARKAYLADLRELGKRPQVYVKLSEILRRVDGRVIEDVEFYRPRLDEIWGIFGEDRVIYGSDWPNSDRWKPYPDVFKIANAYVTGKGRAAAEKYFWKNSVAAYRWVRRDASQPAV